MIGSLFDHCWGYFDLNVNSVINIIILMMMMIIIIIIIITKIIIMMNRMNIYIFLLWVVLW